jgi:CubicO group peptidase (beta-lactamase class C family)
VKKYIAFILVTIIGVVIVIRSCNHQTTKAYEIKEDSTELSTDPVLAPLASKIDGLLKECRNSKGYNCAVLIARDNQIILQKGYGYADYRNKSLIDKHTSFQLASVSKPITATAILILWEREQLKIKDKVSKYISGFPYEDLTIDMLLCHRSGLPNYMYFCDEYVTDKTGGKVTNEDIISLLIRHRPSLMFTPGKRFMYSNTNYCLLASIVEKVSGQSFSEFLRKELFEPLHMTDSYLLTDKAPVDNKALAYTHGFARLGEDYLDGVVGDKGICSSVSDLYKFHQGLENGLILKKETLTEAYKPRSFEKKGEKNYGYGWRMKKQSASDFIIYHNGWWRGFNTLFFRRLKDNTVVIILNNKLNKSIYRITPILEILDGSGSEFDSEDERVNVSMIKAAKKSKA